MNQQPTPAIKLFQFLGSRLALNCYFWIFIFLIKHIDADDQHAYSEMTYYGIMIFLLVPFALLGYVNNLVLMPKLLFKHKRLWYWLSISSLTFVIAYVYVLLLKLLPVYMPGLDSLQMSIIMAELTPDATFAGVMNDIQTYLAFMIVWVFIYMLLGFYYRSMNKLRQLEQAVAAHKDAELAFLKEQLNPHFLFNTLNNLYALSIKKADETPDVIMKLSSVLRYVLYEANTPTVSFEQEKEAMQAYIDIELLRLPNSPNMEFMMHADKEMPIAPLLWLPILENVFKHNRMNEQLMIHFNFGIEKGKMRIYCKNSIEPTTHVFGKKEGGIGIQNLAKRLALLYPEKHKLHIQTSETFYEIEVLITLA